MKTSARMTRGANLFLGACTSSGSAERNAPYGAAAGAAAGAIAGESIAGSPGKGALIGAGVGVVGGAIVGCSRADDCFGRARNNSKARFDSRADRSCCTDPKTGDTWWKNVDFSSYGRGRP